VAAVAARCTYHGPYRAQVVRSLLALKLLSTRRRARLVAAPPPRCPSGVAATFNWDYRYCWLRDASLTVRALFDLGYAEEAGAFVSWLLHSTRLTGRSCGCSTTCTAGAGRGADARSPRGPRGSRPVRIRNAAAAQLQLDTTAR